MFSLPDILLRCRGSLRLRWLVVLAAFLVVQAPPPAWGGQPIALHLLDRQRTVFADREVVYRVEAKHSQGAPGRLVWRFLVGNGVIARGEEKWDLPPNLAAVRKVVLDIPAIREGIRAEALLVVTFVDDRGRVRAAIKHPVHVYGHEPAAHRRQWMESLDLHVYDPTGATLRVLDEFAFPYRPVDNVLALQDLGTCTLIVGEGLPLRGRTGLFDEAYRAASHGAAVVFLAPTEGALHLPTMAPGQPIPERFMFQGRTIITELDRFLDCEGWAPEEDNVLSTFRPSGHLGGVELLISPTGGWPWVEFSFANGGRLVLVGFAIIRQWEASPTPRFLFSRLLEYAASERRNPDE